MDLNVPMFLKNTTAFFINDTAFKKKMMALLKKAIIFYTFNYGETVKGEF